MTTQLIIKLHFLVVDKYPMMLQSLAGFWPASKETLMGGKEEKMFSLSLCGYI